MYNQEAVKTLAESTSTAKIIFNALADRKRFRHKTNLNQFQYALMNDGQNIVLDDYLKTFIKLDELGVGSLIKGRNGKPNRFKWNYNLKEVGKAGLGKSSKTEKEVKEIKRRPGRPAGAKNKSIILTQTIPNSNPVNITINLPTNVIEALLEWAKKAS